MKIRLSSRDIELICFLGRYKQIKAVDCKKIYQSKDYHRKRLKVLEKGKYIKRENTYYIKIDIEGRKLLQDFGYESYNLCRNKNYQDRIKDIAKIAMLAFEDDIRFIPSWELKESKIYTDLGRKYIGELRIEEKKYIVYYISNRNNSLYIKNIITDINKMFSYDNVIIFLEDFNRLNKRNKYFMLNNKFIHIINPTEENLQLMQSIKDIDVYDIAEEIYKEKEILLSNWDKADYMTEDENYIIIMPFIDTNRLHELNIAYNDNKEFKREIDILTLQENIKKIDEILIRKTNIIGIDKCLEKIKNTNMLCF